MGRRVPAGWLIGLLLAATTLGLLGALMPARPCRLCNALARRCSELRIDCPECGDVGKISFFRSRMRPPPSEPLSQLLRSYTPGFSQGFMQELSGLVEEHGRFPAFHDYLARSRDIRVRFLQTEGKDYLVVLTEFSGIAQKDYSLASLLLFSVDGRSLDHLRVWCDTVGVELHPRILEGASADGAQLSIVPTERNSTPLSASRFEYSLAQWEERGFHAAFIPGEGFGPEGFCRIRIRNDRFDVLQPKPK